MPKIATDLSMFRSTPEKATVINKKPQPHLLRDEFDRDRDRIMYSKPFRRLSGKTQIFLAGKDDHTRNRLTHTLEVSQIARTIAKALGLNETLTEAIALGHDIGHTPFGHVGERMLDKIMSGCYPLRGFEEVQQEVEYNGFKHNWQSVKVASLLEEDLQLTTHTLWGMLNHSKKIYGECEYRQEDNKCKFRVDKQIEEKECLYAKRDRLGYYKHLNIWAEENTQLKSIEKYLTDEKAWSVEGYIVRTADEIAQRHHDIEDAIEYKIIHNEELINKLEEIFKECKEANSNYYKQEEVVGNSKWITSQEEHRGNWKVLIEAKDKGDKEKFIAYLSKFIVNLLTTDAIYHTEYVLQIIKDKHKLNKGIFEDIRSEIMEDAKQLENLFSPKMKEYDKKLEDYLRNRILNSYEAQKMDGIGQYIIRQLFMAYVTNPQQLPNSQIPHLFIRYYSDKYECKYEEALQQEKLLTKNGWDIGAMRVSLNQLHNEASNKEYQRALLRTICDYISGMTDKHAMSKHRELYNIEYN